jgi:hypothetical protein
MRAGPGRAVIRAALPIDLLDDLDREAQRRGIEIAELVDLLLVEHLPAVLAEEAHAQLSGALAVARHHALTSSDNEESPSTGDREALSGDEILQLHAEHSLARPVLKGASGGPAT